MAEYDDDELLDEFEVEITDLVGQEKSSRFPSLHALWRFAHTKRSTSLAATSALFLLICLALLASIPDVRNLAARAILPAQATPTPNAGFHLYLQGNPSWGLFTLDGSPRPQLPQIGKNPPLTLSYGAHQITWQAAPFQARHCELLALNISTIAGSCTHDQEVSLSYIPGTWALVVSFFASLKDLSSPQRTALLQQMQNTLNSRGGNEIVYPGETYAVSEQTLRAQPGLCPIVIRITLCYARADQPLMAHLSILPDTLTTPDDPCILAELCYLDHVDCRVFCPNFSVILSGQAADGWNVSIPVRLLWSYTMLSGSSLASDQPDTALRGVPNYQMLTLSITLNGQQWVISPFTAPLSANYPDPLCGQAIQDTTELVNTLTNTDQSVTITQWSDLDTNLATGCLEVAEPAPGVFSTPTPTPATQKPQLAYCLFHLGVVLAVNSTAHQLWPYLPVADAYERGIAQRLDSLLPL